MSDPPPPQEPAPAEQTDSEAPPRPRAALWEALIMFAVATALCSGLWQLRRVVGFVARNLQAFIAAVFLYLPTGLLMRRRRAFADYGLTVRPVGRGLILFGVAALVVFPLFAVGFYLYYDAVCGLAAGGGAALPGAIRRLCTRWTGDLAGIDLRLPADFAQVALAQLLVVALPEEYFFRGYLQSRLEHVWPSRRRLLGAAVGLPLLVASTLFALGHVLVDFNPLRLAVFFPALVFGWMRARTGSILAPVLFHACSNLVSDLLHRVFF